jgi:hypothetical protein
VLRDEVGVQLPSIPIAVQPSAGATEPIEKPTDRSGFVAFQLPPGSYVVTTDWPGFKKQQSVVQIAPAQTCRLDVTLAPDHPDVVQ